MLTGFTQRDKITSYVFYALLIGQEAGSLPPASRTTGHTVSVFLRSLFHNACHLISTQFPLLDSVRYFRFHALLRGICSKWSENQTGLLSTGSALRRVDGPTTMASADFSMLIRYVRLAGDSSPSGQRFACGFISVWSTRPTDSASRWTPLQSG